MPAASRDPDGTLIAHAWQFGDGARGDGQVVQYAYRRSGVYRVGLTVRDDSATDTSFASDGLTVVVNEPPVADAGPDQTRELERGALRRQRLARPGWRDRALRVGLRRRRAAAAGRRRCTSTSLRATIACGSR